MFVFHLTLGCGPLAPQEPAVAALLTVWSGWINDADLLPLQHMKDHRPHLGHVGGPFLCASCVPTQPDTPVLSHTQSL